MDRGDWSVTVCGVAKSWTQLHDCTTIKSSPKYSMPCDLYVTWNLSSLSSLIIFIIGSNSNFTLRESPKPFQFSSVQSLSRVQLCNPMDCSMPGFPVHHQLLELAQTHIHRVSDAIQPSHPLSSPSPPAFNFSQHQGLFQ